MTCPMDVEFHYVSSQRITGILGFVRHPRMAAYRPPWGCQEVVSVNKGTAVFAALYVGTRIRLKRTGVILELELCAMELSY